MNLGFCVKCVQCQSGIIDCFIMLIMTNGKSLYCVSFTTDKKQSNLQYYRNLTTESISPRISSRALVKLNELCQ